jgi:hypothetical protein
MTSEQALVANKLIFGGLFVLGDLVWLWRWLARSQDENGAILPDGMAP